MKQYGVKFSFFVFLFLGANLLAQTDPGFVLFKNNYLGKGFAPVFRSTAQVNILKTNYSFNTSSPSKKPVFCRMEDKLCKRCNVWFQLRAGSDEEYRRLAFPKQMDKSQASKYQE